MRVTRVTYRRGLAARERCHACERMGAGLASVRQRMRAVGGESSDTKRVPVAARRADVDEIFGVNGRRASASHLRASIRVSLVVR